MRVFLLLFVAIGLTAGNSAQAKHCTWLKRREFVRYEFEKTVRARFSKQINRKLQEFLDALTDVERSDIRVYGSPGGDRTETLVELRRRLNEVARDFNTARCGKGSPVFDDGYPSKDFCTEEDGSIAYLRPSFYRGLRLYADTSGIYVEGEIRQDSRRKLIRSHGDFYAGDYFVSNSGCAR